jgi:hypothetical protein
MMIIRLVIGLLLAAGLVCFAVYVGTRQPIWRWRGMVLIKWTVIAGIGAFAVLVLETVAKLL